MLLLQRREDDLVSESSRSRESRDSRSRRSRDTESQNSLLSESECDSSADRDVDGGGGGRLRSTKRQHSAAVCSHVKYCHFIALISWNQNYLTVSVFFFHYPF